MRLEEYLDDLVAQCNAAYQRYAHLAEMLENNLGIKNKTGARRRNQMERAKAEWLMLEEKHQAILSQVPAA